MTKSKNKRASGGALWKVNTEADLTKRPKTSQKPAKAERHTTPPCPAKEVCAEGGGNWGSMFYDSEEKAKAVEAWIKGGWNTKFACWGRTDSICKVDLPNGKSLWCVHYHYDNTRLPPHTAGVKYEDYRK